MTNYFLLTFWLFTSQTEMPIEPVQSESFEMTVSFSVIRIPVWPRFAKAKNQRQLQKEDFLLTVDNKPYPVEGCLPVGDQPVDMAYLIDLSGSMAVGGKLSGSIMALNDLIRHHNSNDHWRIYAFADGQIVQLASHQQPAEWERAQTRLRAYGQTALFDALAKAPTYFEATSITEIPNRAVCIFTDGNDNFSELDEQSLFQLLPLLDVPVYVTGIADGFIPENEQYADRLGHSRLQSIADLTGGLFFLAADAGDLPGIANQLFASIRPDYLLTITVERGPGDAYRRLKLQVPGEKLSALRYRQGYHGSLPNALE